jgi:hypothetical protein
VGPDWTHLGAIFCHQAFHQVSLCPRLLFGAVFIFFMLASGRNPSQLKGSNCLPTLLALRLLA